MKEQMLLRVPSSLKDELKKLASFEGMTLNGFVNSELRRIVDKKKKQDSNT
ncbi:hypothetical protein LMK19_001872 [Listeria monocytogenes]|nr:hypothetical protein [Listeria monocytogenes]